MADTEDVLAHNPAANQSLDLILALVRAVERRQLTKPALLFLVSHQPLAFMSGQILYSLQPLADLLGIRASGDVAALLSEPESLAFLEAALNRSLYRSAEQDG